jgi:hypothetical protein
MVTTDTAQTISGKKTFSSDITLNNAEITFPNGYWANWSKYSHVGGSSHSNNI